MVAHYVGLLNTKNVKVNLHNKALGHYREMAWLPFQKYAIRKLGFSGPDIKPRRWAGKLTSKQLPLVSKFVSEGE